MKASQMNNIASESVVIIAAAAITLISSETIAMNVSDAGPVVWSQMDLRACCTVGSMLGAFLAIAMLKDARDTRRLATHFFASAASGVLFTPIVLRYLGWDLSPDNVTAISGATALMAVGTIHIVMENWKSLLTGLVKQFTNGSSKRDQ